MPRSHGIEMVVHAAALKQVPAAEYNPFEAVKTNIMGAQNVIDAAIDRGSRARSPCSTDKASAVRSTCTARRNCVSDKLFMAGNAYAGGDSKRFAVVRYGNVDGQPRQRGPILPELARRRCRSRTNG